MDPGEEQQHALLVTSRPVEVHATTTGQLPPGPSVGFFAAFAYLFKGMRFIFLEHASLVRFWVWPIVITAAAHLTVVWGTWMFHNEILSLVWPEGVTGFLLVLRWVVRILLFFTMLLTGLTIVYSSTSIVAAPFNDALSERVEIIRKGLDPMPFSLRRLLGGLAMSLTLTAIRLFFYVAVMAVAFLLSLLLPAVGQALLAVFLLVFTWLYLTYDTMDWALARRELVFAERLGFIRRHLRPCLGLGLALWLVMSIPIVSLFLMPAGVAAGTLLASRLDEGGQAPGV